jgi:hypothetical protein
MELTLPFEDWSLESAIPCSALIGLFNLSSSMTRIVTVQCLESTTDLFCTSVGSRILIWPAVPAMRGLLADQTGSIVIRVFAVGFICLSFLPPFLCVLLPSSYPFLSVPSLLLLFPRFLSNFFLYISLSSPFTVSFPLSLNVENTSSHAPGFMLVLLPLSVKQL